MSVDLNDPELETLRWMQVMNIPRADEDTVVDSRSLYKPLRKQSIIKILQWIWCLMQKVLSIFWIRIILMVLFKIITIVPVWWYIVVLISSPELCGQSLNCRGEKTDHSAVSEVVWSMAFQSTRQVRNDAWKNWSFAFHHPVQCEQ